MSLNKLRFLQNLLTLSAVTLIITIWATVSFLIYKNNNLKNETISQKSLPTPSVNPAYNWKTYRNEKYGFEFKYPKDWSILDQNTVYYGDPEYWITVDKEPKSPINFLDIPAPWRDWIRIEPVGFHILISNKSNVELDRTGYNCNLETEGCVFLFKYNLINFKGIKARFTQPDWPKDLSDPEFRKGTGDGGEIIPYSYYSFEKNGKFWTVAFTHSDFLGNHNPIYDQILSTFQFIDESNTTPSPTPTFTCPPSGWIDCMPGPDKPTLYNGCSQDASNKAIEWYKSNCPDYQGIAY